VLPSLDIWPSLSVDQRGYTAPDQENIVFISKGIKYYSVSTVGEAKSNSAVEEDYQINLAQIVDIRSGDLADGGDVVALLGTCRIYHPIAKRLPQLPKCDDIKHTYALAFQPLIYYWKDRFWTEAVDNLNCPAVHKTSTVDGIRRYQVIYPLTSEE
jgi:hypothetical protein